MRTGPLKGGKIDGVLRVDLARRDGIIAPSDAWIVWRADVDGEIAFWALK